MVSYNCQTGAIVFGRIGGDPNRPVEYAAIGVKGYSTDPNGVIEAGLRNDPNQTNRTITVRVRYMGNQSSEVTFLFDFRSFCSGTSALNQPPVYNGGLSNQVATVGQPFSYPIPGGVFSDPEGQQLTYSATGLPRGVTLSGSKFSGVSVRDGVFVVTVFATDTQNNSASTSFTLTVLPSNSCGSDPATLGQVLRLTQPMFECATGLIKFNVVGGDGSTVTYFAIGITVPTTNCFDQLDTGPRMSATTSPT